MNERSPFGKRLREIRREAGLSQEALAERALMSVDTISALERGASQAPQRETLGLLVGALELDTNQRQELEALAVRNTRPRSYAEDRARKHNLPHAQPQLFGREREIEAVKALVAQTPLVTLIGAGGIGKTSLAQHVGREVLNEFADGVWFVDLAPIGNTHSAAKVLAALFGVKERAGQELGDLLVRALQRKRVLLILDNCEHLLTSIAGCVHKLLQACPDMHVLATSRQLLNVANEQTFRVSSLDDEAATALFSAHARRASGSFALTEENAEIVRTIVRALDGIPLAIELAVARLGLLSPLQLAERLSEQLRLLTGGSEMKPRRHQTMRATIDWSHNLLGENEQAVFRRLAVFSGGFSLEAASAVCVDDDFGEWCVLDLLASLVDKSLVIAEVADTEQRFRLFESVRSYALEKIADDAQTVKRRHANYFTALAERGGAVEREVDNFLAALDWALCESGDIVTGARLLTALQELWIEQGLATDAAHRAQKVLETGQALPQHLRAGLWLTLTRCENEFQMAPQIVLEAATCARTLYEPLGDRRGLATALRMQGIARVRLGALAEAQADLERSLELFREMEDLREVARALASLGYLFQACGEFALARAAMFEVLQLTQDVGDELGAALAMMNLAESDFALGHVDEAVARAAENLTYNTAMNSGTEVRAAQESNLSAYLFAVGRYGEAVSMALVAIEDSDSNYVALPLQHLTAIIARDYPARAARLLGYIDKVFTETPFFRQGAEQYTHGNLMSTLRETMSDDEIARLGKEGAAMSEDQVLNLARSAVALKPAITTIDNVVFPNVAPRKDDGNEYRTKKN